VHGPVSKTLASVEHRMSDEQAVQRMVKLMNDFGDVHNVPVKCICYCLTRPSCEHIAGLFKKHGTVSLFYHAKMKDEKRSTMSSDQLRKEALDKFCKRKSIQVICATSALGRGVHFEFPIRFIFHHKLPFSLAGM
jgi:superfamily II DNA helicase RecQ